MDRVAVAAEPAMTQPPRFEIALSREETFSQDCHIARDSRVNLMVMHRRGKRPSVLDMLLSELDAPIGAWSPGQRLVLPCPTLRGTFFVKDVGRMPRADQQRLAEWLGESNGRAQVVSTTSEALLARVDTGTFLDTLYYRLNIVCVDATAA